MFGQEPDRLQFRGLEPGWLALQFAGMLGFQSLLGHEGRLPLPFQCACSATIWMMGHIASLGDVPWQGRFCLNELLPLPHQPLPLPHGTLPLPHQQAPAGRR